MSNNDQTIYAKEENLFPGWVPKLLQRVLIVCKQRRRNKMKKEKICMKIKVKSYKWKTTNGSNETKLKCKEIKDRKIKYWVK